MTWPCQCLPEDELRLDGSINKRRASTKVKINRTGIVDTGKAMKVVLSRQTLPNGVKIPAGFHVWVPGCIALPDGGPMEVQVYIPNHKLNEIIRTINIDKLRK
jgi:hypothetical protein